MIHVKPEERLGNNLFHYVFGRIIQESAGLFYDYSLGTNLLKTPKVDGLKIHSSSTLFFTLPDSLEYIRASLILSHIAQQMFTELPMFWSMLVAEVQT
ncbi:MAG: hypothetical protein EBZ49_01645 [Proteobacteria bacterium]|nr:hypothetical protein [Pseudomonadota bacterium]